MKDKEYGIKITYSWGDDEPIHGPYDNREDAWKAMCEMASKEAYVQNEEMWEEAPCSVYYNAYNTAIDLHYLSDGEYCFYRVVDFDSENRKENIHV